MKELTERQLQILDFITEYIEDNGYPPSYREIGKHFEISSTFGVKRHIDALIKKGYLTSAENTGRTLSVNKPAEVITNEESSNSIGSVPIVGRVAAGYPILSEENIEGTLSLDRNLIRQKENCFALRVKGDSMINAGILEGDFVIVNPQKNADSGEIVVALLDDEATLKRFRKTGSEACLIPENSNYPIIDLIGREDFSIIGKVIGVLRTYN